MTRILCLTVSLCVLAVFLPRAAAVLIAHYEFDDLNNLGLDSAGGNNNGVQQGADSTFSGLSRLGVGALALDGTGTGLRLDNSADFQNLTTFTIAAFVRPDLNSVTWGGGTVPVGRVFGSVGVDGPGGTPFGDGAGYGFGLLRGANFEAGLRYTTFLVQDFNVPAATLANPLQDDQWRHVAVVVNEGDAEFFIDGASVATIAGANPNPTTNPFHIGASGGGDSDSFAGLLDDVRVYNEALDAGAIAALANPPGSGQKGLFFSIDRDLGTISLTNDSAFSSQVRGYSLFSAAGRFEAGNWTSISGNFDQGSGNPTVDPDNDWLVFSSAATDLSEGTLGEATLAGGQSVNLGNAWRKGPFEGDDITGEILLANGTVIPALIEFTGNGGQPFKLGDLNFDNSVDVQDFNILNAGLFTSSIDPETTDPYLGGDLDGDLDVDFFDFLTFKNAFIADGGNPAALQLAAAVPEPASAILLALCGLAMTARRRLRIAGLGKFCTVAILAGGWLAAPAQAALLPVFEYSFPASYDGSVTAVVDLSGAGNNGTMDGLAPLVDDRPDGFDPALMSLTGSNGGHGRTDAIDLLENSLIDDHGGFVMDVWLNWEGTFTDVRKQIDYAGTEWIRTFGGNVQFGLSNGGTVLSFPIDPNQWYHVQGVFDSGSNQTDGGGNLLGDAFLLVNGVLVDSALGVTKTAFGDSLDRPIGINRWAGGGADWNQGRIFNPAVYLGAAEEPMRLEVNTSTGEVRIVHLPGGVLADARNIDFYQISSARGALTTSTWISLEDSGFDASGSDAGDYNGDGTVDAADYTVWRDSLGATGADLAADGNGNGVVDSGDFDVWKDNFGATGGGSGVAWVEAGQVSSSLVGESFLTGSSLFENGRSVSLGQLWDENSAADPTADLVFQYHVAGEAGLRTGVIDLVGSAALVATAVPEPSTVTLLSAIGLLILSRRYRRQSVACLMGLLAVCGITASSSLALVTNDRVYLMGEGAGDGGANGVFVVDSAFAATFDEEVDPGNLSGTAHDLLAWQFDGIEAGPAPAGQGPQFVDVSGRPLAGGGTQLGVRFDGVNDLLIGARLGLPQTSASSQTSTSTPPTSGNVGPFDYRGITSRGFQLWVNPDENNPAFGTAQQAVVLDTNQHGVLISDSGTWVLRYDGVNIDSGVAVKSDAVDNGWSHVMVVQPDVGPFGGGGQLFIDGIAVAARLGGYAGGNDFPLVIGANNGAFDPTAPAPDPVFAGGNADFFAGVVDNMSMFVLGENISGTNFGSFKLSEHNEFVANALAGYVDGDLTGDGQATDSDVTAFIAGWGTTNLVNGIPVGDLNSRLAGDFNFDGNVDIKDWQILVDNYAGGGSLHLGELLAGRVVPEPAAAATAFWAAVLGAALIRGRRQ